MAGPRRPLGREDADAVHQLHDTRGRPQAHRNDVGDFARAVGPGELTGPELRALKALSHGLTIEEADVVLGYAHGAVDAQLAIARRTLGAKTNAQAVARALRLGLIT